MSLNLLLVRGMNDGTGLVTYTETVTSGGVVPVSEIIPAASTNLFVAFAVATAKLKGLFIQSPRAMTLKTNDSGSPQETITLVANQPFIWTAGDTYFTNPFSGDVTGLYVTLASGDAALLTIRAWVDPT